MEQRASATSLSVRVRIREFTIPPVRDVLVVGRDAPIGTEALQRSLTLLHPATFDVIELADEVIESILVRQTLLKKVPEEKLLRIINEKVWQLMTADEVLHLDIEAELSFEDTF